MKIALDVLGGDNAPMANINGALDYLNENDNEIILVGNENIINSELNKHSNLSQRIHVIHASEKIEMNERSTRIFKDKPNSSLVKSVDLVKNNHADAIVSAGNTGALLTTSLFLIGKIPGIKRPALAPLIPTKKSNFILCDVGANANSKPQHLMQFALMATAYMQHLENRKNPKVALLNIGQEKNKGNELTTSTYPLLEKNLENFIGNIESRNLLDDKADVIICDGFTGNIVLKLTEGIIAHLLNWIQEIYHDHSHDAIASPEFLSILKEIQNSLDPEEYGATPLLGINGIVMKCHGSTTERGIKNSLIAAEKAVEQKLITNISNLLNEHKMFI